MIKKNKLINLKKEITSAKNPLFLFDNDTDGVVSLTLLLKKINTENFYPLKTFPKITSSFLKKILSLYPDLVVILDKPLEDENFFNILNKEGTKVLIIDHHEIKKNFSNVEIFNSFPSSEPTSYIIQKSFGSKESEWLALIGCIADFYLPKFFKNFIKEYRELFYQGNLFDLIYSSEIGKIARMIDYSSISSDEKIRDLVKFLLKAKNPYDILIENEKNNFIHEKFKEIDEIIKKNSEKAKVFDNFVYLEYGGKTSLSSEIANFLYFKNQKKFIVVCYKGDSVINISLRGKNAKKLTEEITSKIKESSGGGHELACGLKIKTEDFENFKNIISKKFKT